MPNVSSFGAQTDNAVVQGTVTDRQMVIPDIPPQGLMSVGPRVTPNFVKPREWNDQTTYHFFDAVRDNAGNAYIATKPVVPAGTPLADEDYWFLWADPDTRFDDLNEIVKTFNQRITQNERDILTKAPINHASEETVYGIGNELNYGHVRLAVNDTPVDSDANEGIAATPNFVRLHNTYVTPEAFGAVGDGVTDDTEAFNNFLASGRALALSPSKTYKITTPIVTPQNFKYLNGNSATIKFDAFNGESFCLTLDTAKSTICNITIDCGGNKNGIITSSTRTKVTNVHVKNFTNNGVKTSTGTTTSGYECTFETIIVEAADAAVNSIGINVERADCIFSNIYIQDCNVGFRFTQGYTLINNAHAWIRTTNPTVFNNSAMFACHMNSPLNITNVYCDGYANMLRIPSTTENDTPITILNATMLQSNSQETTSYIVQNYTNNCGGVSVEVSIKPAEKIAAMSNTQFNGRIKFENLMTPESKAFTKKNALAINQKLPPQIQSGFKSTTDALNYSYLINNSLLVLNYNLTTTAQIEAGTHNLLKNINALSTYADDSIISMVNINGETEQLLFDGTNSIIKLRNKNVIPNNTSFTISLTIPIIV